MEPADFDPPLTHCRLCGSDRIRAFDRDYRGRTIDHCDHCGVRFMNPQYTEEYLARFYSGYINVHAQDGPAPRRWRSKPKVREASKARCLRLMSRYVEPGPILMVGCGDGLELRVARELGWAPHGYDIDPDKTAEVAAKFDVPVHCGPFERLDPAAGRYRAVFMDQVIEHPKDPARYLAHAHALLEPSGVLFLGMPNIGSMSNSYKTTRGRLGFRQHRRGSHYSTKHHIFYYSPPVMRRLLDLFGYDVLVVRGSLKPTRNPVTPLVSRWIPWLDSSFITVARRRETVASVRAGAMPRTAGQARANVS